MIYWFTDEKELKKHNKMVAKQEKKKEKRPMNPIFIGLIICGAGLLLAIISVFIFPSYRVPLLELFKEYPLSSWSNLSHYSKYTSLLGYSLIPGLVFLGFRFLGWLLEIIIMKCF
ncbi:MAG: hypothetical protein IJX17_02245 [Clostridia bacterium]|nr:hypothetical protein [Clostridia bacterium]